MNVEQVTDRLETLSVDELRAVQSYEEANKNRVTVRRAIEERLNRLLPLANYDEMTVEEIEREVNDLSVDELRAIQNYETEHKARRTLLERIENRLNWLLPIGGYHDLTVSQIVPQLEAFGAEDLRRMRQYEVEHQNRVGVIEPIDRRLAMMEQPAE
jgi:hypothetical protein